jgi:hypothetical protein
MCYAFANQFARSISHGHSHHAGRTMLDTSDSENPDRMTPGIALLGYGLAALLTFLVFWLAVPVTG